MASASAGAAHPAPAGTAAALVLQRRPGLATARVPLPLQVLNVAGRSADLRVQLDEPGTIFYAAMVNGTAECPPAAELFELKTPAGAQLPPNATGTFKQLDYESATTQLAPLADGVAYRVCTVARDDTNYQNNQTEVSSVVFVTPDITPPALAVALAPGSDGGASCSRDSFRCNATLAVTLSEPGTVALVVFANATLPANASDATAAQLLGAAAADLFPGARLATANVTVAAAGSAAGGSAALALFPELDSQSAFTILAAAVDAAGNVNTTVAALAFTTPDVTPPAFMGPGPQLTDAQETSLTLAVNMSEPCTVKYLAQTAGAPAPSPAQLAAAANTSNATLAVGSASVAAAGQPASLAISGLAKGTLYDVYLLASDAAGNQQPAVANISGARTIDNTPPTIANLSVSYKLPMTLVISAVVDKPGRLHYMAKRLPAERPGAVGDVLAGAGANFSGSAVVTEPGKVRPPVLPRASSWLPVAAGWELLPGPPATNPSLQVDCSKRARSPLQVLTVSLCVTGGEGLVLYLVAQDDEGAFAGRVPNNSTMSEWVPSRRCLHQLLASQPRSLRSQGRRH
jgi:hypothetical protein